MDTNLFNLYAIMFFVSIITVFMGILYYWMYRGRGVIKGDILPGVIYAAILTVVYGFGYLQMGILIFGDLNSKGILPIADIIINGTFILFLIIAIYVFSYIFNQMCKTEFDPIKIKKRTIIFRDTKGKFVGKGKINGNV